MNDQADHTLVTAARIAAGDDRTRYDDFAVALHWATVVLVLAQFGLAELWDLAPHPAKRLMIFAHMSFGIVLGAVVVLRIIWRALPGHRVRPAATGLVEIASKAVHSLLYLLLVAQTILGFLLRWGGNAAMIFFGLKIPPFFPPFEKPLRHLIGEAHEYVGSAIIILAAGHAAAALVHHFALRDDVLWRMLPGHVAGRHEMKAASPEQAAKR